MKKVKLLTILSVMSMLALSSCGGGSKPSESSSTPASEESISAPVSEESVPVEESSEPEESTPVEESSEEPVESEEDSIPAEESEEESVPAEESIPAEESSEEKVPGDASEEEPASEEAPVSEEESVPAEESSEEEEESYDDSGSIIKKDVTIKFGHTFSYVPLLESFISGFKKLEPHVTVELYNPGGGYDGIRQQNISDFSTGEYPDLTICYPDHVVDYMDYNKVVQLDSYMDNKDYGWTKAEKDDIVDAFLEEGQAYPMEGTYSLPFAKSAEGMYYNKTVLVGLDLSSIDATINNGKALTETYLNNLTWEELFGKLAPAIVEHDKDLPEGEKLVKTDQAHHAVFGYDADDNLFITLAMQYEYGYTDVNQITGEGELLWNNDDMKGLMKTFNDAYQKGYLLTKSTNDNSYVNTLFTQQNVLFSVGSTGGIKYQYSESNNWEVGVAKIPQAEDHDDQIISQGPGICMLDHGKDEAGQLRKLASWLFYKYMTNTDNAIKWAVGTGYTPVRESAFETEAYAEYTEEAGPLDLETLTARNALYSLDILDGLYINPAFKGSSTSRSQCGALLTNCLLEKNITDKFIEDTFALAYNNVRLVMDS